MPELFFQGITVDILVFSPPFFTSWSRSQCVIVFAQKDLTYTLVVLVTVYIGGWSSPRITLLCIVKGKRSHLFELSEAAQYRNKRQAFETALSDKSQASSRRDRLIHAHKHMQTSHAFSESELRTNWTWWLIISHSRAFHIIVMCAAPCRPSALTFVQIRNLSTKHQWN